MENEFIKCKSCGTNLTAADNFCPDCGAKKDSGFTKCNSCGAELTATDNFCPNCGVKRNGKSKKPLFKKWWFWLIIVLLIVLVIGVISISKKDTTAEAVPQTSPKIDAPAVQAPEPSLAPATSDKSKKLEFFKSSVKTILEENFDYVEVESDETGVTISLTNDGFASTITQSKSLGLDETFPEWVSMKGSMLDLYNSIADIAETLGLDNTLISLAVINDLNTTNCFLLIMDGIVVYDYMAE